jgi:hypothetical protein
MGGLATGWGEVARTIAWRVLENSTARSEIGLFSFTQAITSSKDRPFHIGTAEVGTAEITTLSPLGIDCGNELGLGRHYPALWPRFHKPTSSGRSCSDDSPLCETNRLHQARP